MARISRGRIAPPKTWADTVTRFIDHHRTRRRSELTLRWYRADLDLFAAWYREARGEEPALAAIDAEALLDFQEHLAGRVIEAKDPATGKKVKARKPKPATINRRLSAVKSLIAWAVRNGFREEVLDPPPNLALPPRVIKSLDPARQRKLLKEIERRNDHRAREVVLILLHTGMRVAELCALTWGQVDLTRGKSAVTIAGKGGKAADRRAVAGTGGRRSWTSGSGSRRSTGRTTSGRSTRCSSRRGGTRTGGRVPLGTQGVQKMLGRTRRSSGVEKLTPHMLRHTFATNHMLARDPLPLVQYWMGHSRLETTAIYTQVGPEERRKAMDKFTLPESRRGVSVTRPGVRPATGHRGRRPRPRRWTRRPFEQGREFVEERDGAGPIAGGVGRLDFLEELDRPRRAGGDIGGGGGAGAAAERRAASGRESVSSAQSSPGSRPNSSNTSAAGGRVAATGRRPGMGRSCRGGCSSRSARSKADATASARSASSRILIDSPRLPSGHQLPSWPLRFQARMLT